jgi:hypothetical protein
VIADTKEKDMAGFTPERRVAENRTLIPPSGDRRRKEATDTNIAERVDPTVEEAYWRENYKREPYYERGYTFDDYYPAYRIGWEARVQYEGRSFDAVERELERSYRRSRGKSQLGWDKNRHAARAAWERFDPTFPFENSQ